MSFEKKVVIEIDGGQHSDHQLKDAARDEWLKGQGFLVIRFWNNDVLQNIEAVLERISQEILAINSNSP